VRARVLIGAIGASNLITESEKRGFDGYEKYLFKAEPNDAWNLPNESLVAGL
jgi:hypothetical protein